MVADWPHRFIPSPYNPPYKPSKIDPYPFPTQLTLEISRLTSSFVGQVQSTQTKDVMRERVKDWIEKYYSIGFDVKFGDGKYDDVEINTETSKDRIQCGFIDIQFIAKTPMGELFLKNLKSDSVPTPTKT